jgi:hypothetical protein
MMVTKICPVISKGEAYLDGGFTPCQGERCMWYDEEEEQCAVYILAMNSWE